MSHSRGFRFAEAAPISLSVYMANTAAGSRLEVSRTTSRYVPYPRLRVRMTCAQLQFPGWPAIRRCSAPSASVQALDGSYALRPPRSLGAARTVHSYPLNRRIRCTSRDELVPGTTETVLTYPPSFGNSCDVKEG